MKNSDAIVQEIIRRKTADLMDTSFPCVCGRKHTIPMKYLISQKGAVGQVGSITDKLGITGRGALIYDRKIEETVVNAIAKKIGDQGLEVRLFPYGDGGEKISPEIGNAERVVAQVRTKADYLVSVGSGVISDLTKYAAHILELPYHLIATAPSMNGYTSSMAALTDRGIKGTLLIKPASAIFADIGVLQDAPLPMIRAGLGDIVSKSVCNADWKLSHLVKNTYFCTVPFRITDKSEPLYLGAAEEIGDRSEEGISILTDGIMRSGASMTIIGTSTPSSGAEHFLSHYWDLRALMEGREKELHGVQVGVATLIILGFYDFIRNYPVKKNVRMNELGARYQSEEKLNGFIEMKFGRFSAGIKAEFHQKYMSWEKKRKELEGILDNWDSIWNELDPYIRPIEPVREALSKSGSASHYSHLGKKSNEVVDALENARFIRGRYTILDLAADLGIMPKAAEAALNV
jgi:glycerol-1-phosphate dehydrogenase [NAD(P)+]